MKKLLSILVLLLVCSIVYSQTARVVGYLPTYRFSSSSKIDYCKLTHLCLSFANPDSEGNIVMPSITSVVEDAKNDNPDIIVMVSLAGAALTTQQAADWSNLIDVAENRPAFIEKIVDYALTNNLDGIDIDLEWDHVTSGYSDFVIELAAALDAEGKSITAAFPNQTRYEEISQAALDVFDFINIMSYDATGPWQPNKPGQHSSYKFAENGVEFWKNNVGVESERLNMGLPFYGYDFVSSSSVKAVTYAQMISKNTSYADIDNVDNAHYNGRPTIEAKVELANNETGGVLIWELGQDAFNEYSLLTTIHKKYTSLKVITSGLCGNDITSSATLLENDKNIKVYPNPSSDYLFVSNLDKEQYFAILDISGKQVSEGFVSAENQINITHLLKGMYFLRFENGTSVKFVKN